LKLATIAGLAVSLGGVALLASPAVRVLGDPTRIRTRVLEQLVLWLLLALVLGIALAWERAPLASLGLKRGWARSLALAALLSCGVIWLVSPLALRLVAAFGLPSIGSRVAQFAALPIWLEILSVVTAGVVEETLFRGYALERLAASFGSVWLAALLTWLCFTVVHWPVWGPGGVIVIACTGAVFTLFYVWQRDLVANVVAHVAVDAFGWIVVPLLWT